MRITINAASAKMGGAENYLANFLRYLSGLDSRNEHFVFLPSDTAKGSSKAAANIRLFPLADKEVGSLRRLWWEQVTLRRFLTKLKIDVLFSTANFGMFRCPAKQILLVRNALYFSEVYQQLFLPRHSLRMRIAFRLRRWLVCRSVQSADVVVTPTRAMLDELRAYVDIPASRASVCPYGAEPAKLQPPRSGTGEARPSNSPVRLLYVSLYSEHKNLNTLLRAMPLLNAGSERRFFLQTTADPGWQGAAWTVTHRKDIALAHEPAVSECVHFVGPLSREQMGGLYRGSDVFVYPSLIESFGFPMAEAMCYGLPIVASDTPVNREICGKAAVYFIPLDAEDLARQVRRVASDPILQEHLRSEGQERARTHFRWDTHVREILSLASRIASDSSRELEAAQCFD